MSDTVIKVCDRKYVVDHVGFFCCWTVLAYKYASGVFTNLSELCFGVLVFSVHYLKSVSFICFGFPKKSMAQKFPFHSDLYAFCEGNFSCDKHFGYFSIKLP